MVCRELACQGNQRVCTVRPVRLHIINPMSKVGQVFIISVLLGWRQQNRGAGGREASSFLPPDTSASAVHSLPSPDLALWKVFILGGCLFRVLSPALVLTFREVSLETGSIFWTFLLLVYPISTAEVPKGQGSRLTLVLVHPSPLA